MIILIFLNPKILARYLNVIIEDLTIQFFSFCHLHPPLPTSFLAAIYKRLINRGKK